MNDFALRSYSPADALPVVDVVNAEARHSSGINRAVLDALGNVRLGHYVPGGCEKVVAVNKAGKVAGYACVADREQHVVYEIAGAVHPEFWGKGLGTRLLHWGEQRVNVLSQCAPAGVRTVLQANVYEVEQRARRLLTQAGYTKTRVWSHMLVEFDAEPPVPTIPAGMTLRTIDLANDWDILAPAMDEAFADHWGAIPLTSADAPVDEQAAEVDMPEDERYSNTPGYCFVVLAGQVVAGGILCNAQIVERGDTGRVGSLFVRPHYRRQGVGHALMLAAFRAFWQHGVRRIITDTDANSFTGAPKLYTNLGMREYRREYLYEKEIRPGIELRRLKV